MSSVVKQRARSQPSTLQRWLQHGDVPFKAIIVLSALVVLSLMAGVGIMLWVNSQPSREAFGLNFLFGTEWNPPGDIYGAVPFIIGTLGTSLIALLLAVPLGVAIAIFLTELCPPRLRAPLGQMVEMLAAIPSVVYGMWGIFVFIPDVVQPFGDFLDVTFGATFPILSGPFFGPSILSAGLILAIMILPTISAISRDVILAVPAAQREASLGLGSTKWEMIWKVVLPYSLSGILGAIILGLGRALGETMAITMTIGNVTQLPISILNPGYSMASVIANEWGESRMGMYQSALLQIGLLLFAMSLLLNVLARLLVWSVARKNPEQRT
jgi:phosphate transport system permease protein